MLSTSHTCTPGGLLGLLKCVSLLRTCCNLELSLHAHAAALRIKVGATLVVLCWRLATPSITACARSFLLMKTTRLLSLPCCVVRERPLCCILPPCHTHHAGLHVAGR